MQLGVNKAKDFMVKELTSQKYKKNDLTEIYASIFQTEASGKKQEIAEKVANQIIKEITTEAKKINKQGLSKEALRLES